MRDAHMVKSVCALFVGDNSLCTVLSCGVNVNHPVGCLGGMRHRWLAQQVAVRRSLWARVHGHDVSGCGPDIRFRHEECDDLFGIPRGATCPRRTPALHFCAPKCCVICGPTKRSQVVLLFIGVKAGVVCILVRSVAMCGFRYNLNLADKLLATGSSSRSYCTRLSEPALEMLSDQSARQYCSCYNRCMHM